MMENQTIINVGVILMMITGFAVVGPLDQESTHYCEEREIKAYCEELSSSSKTCYTLPAKQGGKRCSEGWEEIPFVPERVPVVQQEGGLKYSCDVHKCTLIE